MSEPIRILQVVTQMARGGLESRLMDIYRNIDRSRVQFDFYTFRLEKGIFDDEIINMGGKIYYNNSIESRLTNINKEFCDEKTLFKDLNKFLTLIKEYKEYILPYENIFDKMIIEDGYYLTTNYIKEFSK